MNFINFIHDRKDCSKSIVRDIYLYDELNIGNLVYENRYSSKSLFQGVEGITAGVVELSENILLSEVDQ